MSMLRYDPFREFERVSEQLLGGAARGVPRSFPMDAYRRGEVFHVDLDLPGVSPDSIELTVEQNVLTIRAERVNDLEGSEEVIVSERPQGSFSRQLLVSQSLDTEQLKADYVDGVIRLTIPVAERAKPRKIEIGRSGNQPTTIDGKATSPSEPRETA
jgi:HSP20 family protein